MLKTDNFTFDRHGIFTFLKKLSYQQWKSAKKMCIEHARRKKTKQPCDWVWVPILLEAV